MDPVSAASTALGLVQTVFQAGNCLIDLLEKLQENDETVKKFKEWAPKQMQHLEEQIQRRYIAQVQAQPDDAWGWLCLAILCELKSTHVVWRGQHPMDTRPHCLQEAAKCASKLRAAPQPEHIRKLAAPLWYNIGLALNDDEVVEEKAEGETEAHTITTTDCFLRAIELDATLPLPWIHLGLSAGLNAEIKVAGETHTGRSCLMHGIAELEKAARDGAVIEEHYSLARGYYVLGMDLLDEFQTQGRTFTKEDLLTTAVQYDLSRWESWEHLLNWMETNQRDSVKWSPGGDTELKLHDLLVLRARWRAFKKFQLATEKHDEFQKRVSVFMHHDVVDPTDPFIRSLKTIDQSLQAAIDIVESYEHQPVVWKFISTTRGTFSQALQRCEYDIQTSLLLHIAFAGNTSQIDASAHPPAVSSLHLFELHFPPQTMSSMRCGTPDPNVPPVMNGWVELRRVAIEYRKDATKGSVQEELACLVDALHPQIVRLEGYYERPPPRQAVLIVMEPLAQAGITDQFLGEYGTWLNRIDWSLSLIDAVAFLHDRGFAHNALCAENIWFTSGSGPGQLTLKVGGFYAARTTPLQGQRAEDLARMLDLLQRLAGRPSLNAGVANSLSDPVQQALAKYRDWLWALGGHPGFDELKKQLQAIKRIRDPIQLTGSHSTLTSKQGSSSASGGPLRGASESGVLNELTCRSFDAQGMSVSLGNRPNNLENELRRLRRNGRGATSITFRNCLDLTDRLLEDYLPGLSCLREVRLEQCPRISSRSLEMLVVREDPVTKLRPPTNLEVLSLHGSQLFDDAGLVMVLKNSPKLRSIDVSGTSVSALDDDSALITLAELVMSDFISGLTSFSMRRYNRRNVSDEALLKFLTAIGPNLTELGLMACVPRLLETLTVSCPTLKVLVLEFLPNPMDELQHWAEQHNVQLSRGPVAKTPLQ